MNAWIEQQIEQIRALRGRSVAGWLGVEMALVDVGHGGLPQWNDSRVPVLQMSRVDMILSDGAVVSIVTYQGDDHWGLCCQDDLPPLAPGVSEGSSIFRDRVVDELPGGAIDRVDVLTDVDGEIAELHLLIDGRVVSLRAGEVYQEADGSFRICEMDESVLVQVDHRRPVRAAPA